MTSYKMLALAAGLTVATLSPSFAADLDTTTPPVKAKPILDTPFFTINDNRLSFSYIFDGSDPGVPGKTAKQAYSFTHFDVWAYGTNFINLNMFKSDQHDPASPCGGIGTFGGCAGAAEFYGMFRSTLGFNELFKTNRFTMGPLHDVSFEFGAEGETENTYLAPDKKAVVAGLQFGFDLPYKGFFNVAPLYYQEWNHNSFLMPSYMSAGYTGLSDGNLHFNPTWAVEINYYMDLGFLPPNLQYFSISGRAGFYGPKGTGAWGGQTIPAYYQTKVEINSEPIRLTFDVSKLMWGQKYSHFLETWVAYRYWENKFGFNDSNPANPVCFNANGTNNGSCSEKSLYAGVTLKF